MKKIVLSFVFVLVGFVAWADEGMWLLPYLNKLNIKEMRAKGLKLTAEDIYSVNKASLKDAVVIFGGGCTGEVVSADGLLLTNHHCGYGAIQNLSSPEHNYLMNGFWAMDRGEEIPAPGLSVTFIRVMEDVTAAVVGEAAEMGVGSKRDGIISKGIAEVTEKYKEKYPQYTVRVQDFMGGNQYFMVASEVFRDVRLVGTPPASMGKFGGDTDNWMWPRHTDDFSMFRIYAGPDNSPADYSPENRPYNAPVHLKISLGGVKENDFAMIIGFPGSTDRYMTTYEMTHMVDNTNTDRINIRGERLAVLMEDMEADPDVRLKYASKHASSANYWKNSIGMNKALVDNGIPARKAALEERFQAWADGRKDSPHQYHLALDKIDELVGRSSKLDKVYMYLYETLWSGSEIVGVPQRVAAVMKVEDGKVTNKQEVMDAVAKFYRDYNEPTDRRASKKMFAMVAKNLSEEDRPSVFGRIDRDFGGSTDLFVDWMFDNSIYSSAEKLSAFLDNYSGAAMDDDPAAVVSSSVRNRLTRLSMQLQPLNKSLGEWRRVYIKGLAEMDPLAKMYPDANFSMRLTYGLVLPYDPRDGVTYHYYTTLKGVMEKEDPENPIEFTVDPRLKEAYREGDYGRYGEDGELRLNFLSNNDITGGNSGSPVLNGRGELIGLAFDGNWEAMSGDVMFESELQRCINVDIRYVLWTIDRFAGAGHLVREMTIVK